MTYLRSVPSEFDNVFQLRRYERHALAAQPAADRQPAEAASGAALDVARTVLRSWRQALDSRRARHRLVQLDDHLLRDIGLSRTDLHFGDFETLGRHRRAGGIR
jgi:uncharacterized protein YjiS (DUF1127 family)